MIFTLNVVGPSPQGVVADLGQGKLSIITGPAAIVDQVFRSRFSVPLRVEGVQTLSDSTFLSNTLRVSRVIGGRAPVARVVKATPKALIAKKKAASPKEPKMPKFTTHSGPPQALFGIKLPGLGDVIKTAAGFLPIPGAGTIAGLIPGGGRDPLPSPSFAPVAPKRCIPPFFPDGRGGCVLDVVPGPGGGGTGARRDFGDAVMGQFGVALEPASEAVQRLECPPGMRLGKDDLCYNKSQLRNSERKWPAGRKPLLTGGDLNAISKAKRAATRLDNAMKNSRSIGLLKPAPKKRR